MTGPRIALLRGVNVGGRNSLPMAGLRGLLADLGAEDVSTYIQSGNAVFRGGPDADSISHAVEARFGFRPRCVVLAASDLAQAIAENPFPEAEATPKALHLFFLAGPATVDPAALDTAKSAAERWRLRGRVFYLHSPLGLARSKLAEGIDRRLGTAATGRNWNTVLRLAEMAGVR